VSLGSYGASLTLGCIRLPFQGTKWTDSQEKLKFLQEICVFHAISSSFFALLRQKQVVRYLAIAVYLLNRLPFLCLLCLLWLMGFLDGV
jgi:hypothetical protein